MPFLIADVIDIGKNIEAVHQKDILGISQRKNKIELWSSHEIERSLFVSKYIYEIIFQQNEKMEIHCHCYYYCVEMAIL